MLNVQASFVATLIDEWWRCGIRHTVVSPGSRSSPLAAALVADGRITLHVRLDERSGAFFALGLASAAKTPVLIVTTSGTAAAELVAGVVEADLARVPLVCVTADRPVALHSVGAPQTIGQVGIFAGATRYAVAIDAEESDDPALWRSLASRLVAEATSSATGPGPVHLNLALREPLAVIPAPARGGRADGAPWHVAHRAAGPAATAINAVFALVGSIERGLIVVGEDGCPDGAPERIYALADALGWPVLADPRAYRLEPHPRLIAHGDAIFRSSRAREVLSPDAVIHFGAPPLSKVLTSYFAARAEAGMADIVIDSHGAFFDQHRVARLVVGADPSLFAEALLGRLAKGARTPTPNDAWQAQLVAAEQVVAVAIADAIANGGPTSEPGIARKIYAQAPKGATLVVSASMPVRDVEWFATPRRDAPKVCFNRGANGIDGVVSSILGIAAEARAVGAPRSPVIGLLGDLAFLHDLSGLVWGTHEHCPDAALVVIDNGGGGIFSFLPQAEVFDEDVFERMLATPQRADIAATARALGASVRESDGTGIEEALHGALDEAGISVVICRTDRRENRALHRAIEAAAVGALDAHLDESVS